MRVLLGSVGKLILQCSFGRIHVCFSLTVEDILKYFKKIKGKTQEASEKIDRMCSNIRDMYGQNLPFTLKAISRRLMRFACPNQSLHNMQAFVSQIETRDHEQKYVPEDAEYRCGDFDQSLNA